MNTSPPAALPADSSIPPRGGEPPKCPPADGGASTPDQDADAAFWFELVPGKAAAEFIHITTRKVEKMRQDGDGPRYVVISSRCIRYRRIDLHEWAEARLRQSTSDDSGEIAA